MIYFSHFKVLKLAKFFIVFVFVLPAQTQKAMNMLTENMKFILCGLKRKAKKSSEVVMSVLLAVSNIVQRYISSNFWKSFKQNAIGLAMT